MPPVPIVKGIARRLVIGLTGGYGSGKSTVLRMLRSLGAKVSDADALAHRALQPGNATYKKIIRLFGREILRGRMIDRVALADRVLASGGRN